MKKILSMLLTAALLLGIGVPTVSLAAPSTVLQRVKEFNFTAFNEGTTGDYASPSTGDGVIIRTYDTSANQVCITTDPVQGKVMKFGPAKTSYDSGICIKRNPVVDSNPVLGIKIKAQAANSTTWVNPACIDVFSSTSRICRLWLRWGSNGGAEYPRNLYFRNNTGSAWGSEHLIASDFDDGTPGWLDIKLVFNHIAQTYDIYVGDSRVATGESYFDTTADTDISEIYFYCSGDNGSIMVDDINIYKSMPTVLTLTSPVNGASNADLTDTLTFTANNENLNVSNAVLTITPEGGSDMIINNAASVDSVDNKKIHFDLSESGFDMTYEKTYTGTVSGIKDTLGNDVQEAEFTFTTRVPRLIVGEPVFSSGVGSVVITNERPDDPLNAAVIFAAFSGNELKDIAFEADTVIGGGEKTFTKPLEYSAGYTYKAFIWDSLESMQPIGSYEAADNVTADVEIDYLSGEGTLSGTLEQGSRSSAIILHPEKNLSEIEVYQDGSSNIKDIIAYIGEAECSTGGSYSIDFVLNLPNSANGQEITVLSGGSGISQPSEDTFTYYNKETVTGIFDAIKNALNGEEIVKLLSGQTLINGIDANVILKLDKTDYDTLNDKAAACINLIGMNFTDIESVHTAFKAAVARQMALEEEASAFTPVYFDFEPVDGVVSPMWSVGEKGSYTNVKVEPKSETLGGVTNTFHRFTFGETEATSVGTSYTEREWRAYIALEKVFNYNDKPKVISFKVRQSAEVISGEMEMIGATLGDRSNKEIIFTTSSGKLCGENASAGEWHTVDVILDGTGLLDKDAHAKKMYTILDGELKKQVVLSKNDGSIAIKHLQMHMSFPQEGNSEEKYLDFDDLSVTEYSAPEIIGSNPENGAQNVDITNKIKVMFDKGVAGVTENNFALYGGDGSIEVTGVSPSVDKKTVTFTLNKKLDYNTPYKVVITGIKDSFGEDVTPYIFEFKTREKAVIADSGSVFYEAAAGGTTDCSVTITNEDSTPKAATVIFASFDGDKMTQAKSATNESFTGDWTPTLNLNEGDEGKIKMFAWDSLSSMQPLALHPVVNTAKADVQIDYKTGKGRVNGTLSSKASGVTATVLVLKPGMDVEDDDPIAYIGEVECDENGSFSADFEIEISSADSAAKKTVAVYVGAKGVGTPDDASFVCFSEGDADAVLSAVKNASDGKAIAELLSGTTLVNGIKANDVLHLNTASGSDYAKLKDKAAACEELKGVTFENIADVWDAFDEAVAEQKAYEAEVDAAISELNAITYDKMEEKLGIYKTLLKPNLQLSEGTYYSRLNPDQKTTLYKQLANTYTFVFGADINKDIEDFAKDILNPQTPSVGGDNPGTGGGGGYRGKNDTEMSLSGIPVSPSMPATAFIDTGSVSWAQESIAYLAQRNIINGIGNNKFAPNDAVTREQIVKIMVLAGEIDVTAGGEAFSDVDTDAWYAPYVSAGVRSGIVTGYGDGSFGSGRNVTRQDLAVFLMRLAKVMGKELPVENQNEVYIDDSSISDYARSAVYILKNAGIMNGMGNGSFVPGESVTRAMAAKAVYELLQYGE